MAQPRELDHEKEIEFEVATRQTSSSKIASDNHCENVNEPILPTAEQTVVSNGVVHEDTVTQDESAGVREMREITMVWSKKWLIAIYASIILVSFVNSLQQQTNFSWAPYVTSDFSYHGLTAITGIVANIVGGVSKLPLASFIDIVGRPEGFMVCLVFTVSSLILMAVCENVQTYAAAQVFYWTGMNGIHYVFDVCIADTALMQNRLIWFAIINTPYVCNTFAGPVLADFFLHHVPGTWRWGYGAFAIITPIVSMTFWLKLWYLGRQAKKQGLRTGKREISNRTSMRSVLHWFIQFDVVGLLLVCGGFSVFLLPLGLAQGQRMGWSSPTIICMLVWGFIFLVLFVLWERYAAPKSFFPFHLLKDKSVMAACLLGFGSWIGFYSYKMYYSSYLQVVFRLSVSKAGYITNIFNIVSCTWSVLISLIFKYTDSYKWGAIIAAPLEVIMTGLMIHFRAPGTPIGLLVMVEVFWAIAGAMLVQVEQIAVMAAVPHQNLAAGLALLSMVTSVGGSIGQAISSALWTQLVPKKIHEYLPEDSKHLASTIYASLDHQLALPWDSPERQAVVRAYGDAQKIMVIVGTCVLIPCLVWACMLRNYRLSLHNTRKGLQA